jgi:hypothetical protein
LSTGLYLLAALTGWSIGNSAWVVRPEDGAFFGSLVQPAASCEWTLTDIEIFGGEIAYRFADGDGHEYTARLTHPTSCKAPLTSDGRPTFCLAVSDASQNCGVRALIGGIEERGTGFAWTRVGLVGSRAVAESRRPARSTTPVALLAVLVVALLARWRWPSRRSLLTPLAVLLATAAAGPCLQSVWCHPATSLAWLSLYALSGFAIVLIARHGSRSLAVWLALVGASALLRWLHPDVTGSWYVDYVEPDGSATVAYRHLEGGLTGLLTQMPFLAPERIFDLSRMSSSLSVGFLGWSVWRGRNSVFAAWPASTWWIWGVLLVIDQTSIYLGCSDAHHVFALVAFSLGFLFCVETPNRNTTLQWLCLLGLALATALVGLTRLELALSPVVYLTMLLTARRYPTDAVERPVWYAIAAGMGVTVLTLGWTRALGQVRSFHASSVDDLLAGVITQSPNHVQLPPLFVDAGSMVLAVLFLLFLFHAARRSNRRLLWVFLAYAALILPKMIGGFHGAVVGGFGDEQRYHIILIPTLLLLVAGGAALVVRWTAALLHSRPRRLLVVTGLAASWIVVLVAIESHAPTMPLAHQAEFRFLRQNLHALPLGATVIAVWLKELHDGRDVDNQLALGHALLVHARPDISWRLVSPDEPMLPKERPLFYYRSAGCSLDPDQPIRTGVDFSEDHRLVRETRELCAMLDRRVETWLATDEAMVRLVTWPIEQPQGSAHPRVALGLATLREE